MDAYADDGEWHLYHTCECGRVHNEIKWPWHRKDRATDTELESIGFRIA